MPAEDSDGIAMLNNQGNETHVCRICRSSERQDGLIAPCLCKGKKLKVHRDCLDEWRSQESCPRAFTHCPKCNFQYVTDIVIETTSQSLFAQLQYRFLIARDLGAFFMTLQLILCGLAKLIHLMDPSESIAGVYPKEWAEKNQAAFSIGPYYCTAVLCFLALTGLLGCCILPAEHRVNGKQGGPSCNGNLDGSDAFVALVIVLAALVVMGIFAAIFFGGFVVQKLVQRHIHLIARRQEARRVVVRDLSNSPELLSSLACSSNV